jgi:PIN domain nuclease of toxin-antitoxin system
LRVLLDTHVFLWFHTDPERLGSHLQLLEDLDNELLVSTVVPWEIAIKHQAGRLDLPEPPEVYVPARMSAIKARSVPVEQTHALAVASLPPIHRDPFDRMLVAQARQLGAPIMTADPVISAYPVETMMV